MSPQTNPSQVCFRGLGQLGAKTIYAAGKQPERRFSFSSALLKSDEKVLANLEFLADNGYIPKDATVFVLGSPDQVRRILGSNANVFDQKEFDPKAVGADVFVDFTFDASEFIHNIRHAGLASPIIVQSNNYRSGRLWVPPLEEPEARGQTPGVFRAADCSLGGAIPALAHVKQYFESLFLHFVTDRNVGKSPDSPFDNAFFFSDSFPRRKSIEFQALTGVDTLVTIASSACINPFYIGMVSGIVDEAAILRQFGSWTRFEKVGFALLLEGVPNVHISREDSTSNHRLPPEPSTVEAFARAYPSLDDPYIVYFTRTLIRRGTLVSFKLGFDVNLTATMSNLHLLEALTDPTLSTSAP